MKYTHINNVFKTSHSSSIFSYALLSAWRSLAFSRYQQHHPRSIIMWITFSDNSINTGCQDGVSDGDCGLRGAINLANAGSISYYHHIHLPAGTFTLTLPGTGEDANVYGDLDIYGAYHHH